MSIYSEYIAAADTLDVRADGDRDASTCAPSRPPPWLHFCNGDYHEVLFKQRWRNAGNWGSSRMHELMHILPDANVEENDSKLRGEP